MEYRVLPIVEDRIRKYREEHRGERPLYIILPSEEADHLVTEVRSSKGYDNDTIITDLDGSKIMKHNAMKTGEIQLSNELPETGS